MCSIKCGRPHPSAGTEMTLKLTRRRLVFSLFSCLVVFGILFVGFYFVLRSARLPMWTVALLLGVTSVVCGGSLGWGFVRAWRNPEWNPVTNPELPKIKMPSSRVVMWILSPFVIFILADMAYLALGLVLVVPIAILLRLGLPISEGVVTVVSWIGFGFLLACAAAFWWKLWNRFASKDNDKEGNGPNKTRLQI